jgi:ATP-dependent exoDNAse (exonuclease V) beta subunit
MSQNRAHKVGVVTASAGTGKTYDLTSRIEAEIRGGCNPERILAATFTNDAARELRERARERLIAHGDAENAVRLLGARVGTINGVCGGLVKEFAFGLGLSPIVDVIDEEVAKSTFRKAADAAIAGHADELGRLSELFGFGDQPRQRKDWRDDVNKAVELARANNIAGDALFASAERSVAEFARLMHPPEPGETAQNIDQGLRDALAALFARYPTNEGASKTGAKALNEIREIAGKVVVEDLSWPKWAKLSKAKGANSEEAHMAPLRAAAKAFSRHPRLLDDIRRYVTGVFSCASEAMRAYEKHKREWGLVDFADQDRLALELLCKADVRLQLEERVHSVFVDEFQDTSPLQLAVFVAMSRIAGSSVWVGDPKQAIYGFRGADPDLITYVAQDIRKATGGEDGTLERNWRSRPGLVHFFNEAFAPTFVSMGLPAKATRIKQAERRDLPGQGPPLAVWRAQGDYVPAIASGVAKILADGGEWTVARDEETHRLTAGDVAILCRENEDCLAVANALAASGMKVAIEREGLFGSLEGKLALAALRWCADKRDTVALVELAQLLHEGEGQPAWFEASLQENSVDAIAALVPLAEDLRAISEGGVHKTPTEYLDAVLMLGGVSNAIRRWGNVEERLLNLEALRGLVASYETDRARNRAPTTATDLSAWLDTQKAKQPASRAKDAVTVLTYHKAKGLEWPLVILTDLEGKPKSRAFGLRVVSEVAGSEIDWRDPLAKRWLRLWPWPFGAQKKDVHLDTAAANSDAGKDAERAERAERVRLLYVGATRARDYLVLALPETKDGWPWLAELKSASGEPAIIVPEAGDSAVVVGGERHPARVVAISPESDPVSSPPAVAFRGPKVERLTFPPLAVNPSDEAFVEGARIIEEIDLGARLPFAGASDMGKVGEALHHFLAADDPSWAQDRRIGLANRLLVAWGVTNLDPRDVVTMGSRFRGFIDGRWPGAVLRREAPIVCRMGNRTLSGRIDALVEAPDVIVVFDHKSFPGRASEWPEQAKKHAGQLRLYREAITAALPAPKPILLALHLPISGEVLMVES